MKAHFETEIFEACILATLASKDAYGYELAKSNDLRVSESAVYPVLRRLANRGYLTVSSQTHQTRLRKIYSITPQGRKRLALLKADWREFQKSVDEILGSETI
jgi:PadR family transcriptional regulator PadR